MYSSSGPICAYFTSFLWWRRNFEIKNRLKDSFVPRFDCNANRVTRLGEFSPIYWVIAYLGHIFNYKRSQNCLATLLLCKRYVYIFDKKWVGLHFGRFWTNSSGHSVIPIMIAAMTKWIQLSVFLRSNRIGNRRQRSPAHTKAFIPGLPDVSRHNIPK
jgi:hypothetical protein